MPVGTVPVFAVRGKLEYFLEVVSHFLVLHVEGTEALDARGVNDVAVARYREHFRESGSVHAFVVGCGYFAGLDILFRQDGID